MSLLDKMLFQILGTRLLPYPRTLMIDPANVCQLRCPLCSAGRRRLDYDRNIMSLEMFKTILANAPRTRRVELFKNGEPFLNRDILAMVRHAAGRKIEVSISTNFSLKKPDSFFDELAASGLHKLVVSLDGASQENYSMYRKGGSFDLVVDNIRKLQRAKAKLNSCTPYVVWQFIVNRFNEDEIGKAEAMAIELGVELDLQPIGLADDLPDVHLDDPIEERKSYWLPQNPDYVSKCYKGDYRHPLFKGCCTQLFTRMVIAADGSVLPCCWAESRTSVFGNLATHPFKEVWHSRRYIEARSRFLKKNFVPQSGSVCFKCNNFGAGVTLKNKLNLLFVVFTDLDYTLAEFLDALIFWA